MRGSVVRRRGLLLALLMPVMVTACTAGPSQRPAVVENDESTPAPASSPPAAVPLPPLTEPLSPSISWSGCDQQVRSRLEPPAVPDSLTFSCATVVSVLDAPDLPGRVPTHIALLKVGSGPIPLVVVNDIEGEAGTLYAAHLAANLPPALLQRFSLIGVDRRGTGDSDPVGCVPREVRGPLLSQDPASGDIDEVLDAARRAGQQCAIDLGNAQLAIDSWRTAGDLEEIRDQLGVPRLNAIARGEGSDVVAAYAARYPTRVGRVVLDGIPDPSADPATVLGDLAAAQQSTLDNFDKDCGLRHCALAGNATAAVTALLDQLRSAPQELSDGTVFSPGLALNAIKIGLANPARWPELGDAIAAARAGSPAKLAEFVEPLVNGSQLAPSQLDGALATECNDAATRLSANQISALADQLRKRSALFGAPATQRLTWCLPWPGHTGGGPSLGVSGLPPILVASTATDPVTPATGTTRAAEQMASAVRISWQGTGHGALTSPCVGEAVRAFLADGKVPTDGTLCPA
ncbi:MAG TPA: alpha/beta hydrolase [Amycolatopsis sp.]|uniref:alpha/beta hydrolase n=1 Tax=Amycolatopsis sp. TaxID=37632 RepID=UPI002B472893|nr:alpha/beta hydrolase [Amycolatopsis sp.]HKS49327.1 alpha/beta hydrolase [Amycolatopsis sp.]